MSKYNRSKPTGAAAILAAASLLLLSVSAVAQSSDVLPIVSNTALTYDQALSIAMADNIDLKIAQENADISAANTASAKASLQPSISITSYGAYGDSSNILSSSPGVSPANELSASPGSFADQNLTLSLPLLTSGKLQKQILSTRLMHDSLLLSAADSKLTVSEAVIENYTSAALDKELVNVAQARLDAESEQVRITQQSVDQGHAAPVDLLREQAELADAGQAVLSTKNDEQLALIALKDILGISQSSTLALSDSLDSLMAQLTPPGTLASALAAADKSSPALKSAEYAEQSAAADTDAAKTSFEPQVFGLVMGDASAMRGGNHSGYTIGIAASLPLYDAGQRRDQVDQAKSKQDIAVDEAKKVMQEVERNTAAAWLNLQSADAEVDSAAKGVDAAQQSFTLADMRYNAGKSIAAERLDALSALVRAKESLDSAKKTSIIARAKLVEAIGS
jgi:outer membrane protein TolC